MRCRAFKVSLKLRVRAFTIPYIGWTFTKPGFWSYTETYSTSLRTLKTPFLKPVGLGIESRSSGEDDALVDRPDPLSLCSGEVPFG